MAASVQLVSVAVFPWARTIQWAPGAHILWPVSYSAVRRSRIRFASRKRTTKKSRSPNTHLLPLSPMRMDSTRLSQSNASFTWMCTGAKTPIGSNLHSGRLDLPEVLPIGTIQIFVRNFYVQYKTYFSIYIYIYIYIYIFIYICFSSFCVCARCAMHVYFSLISALACKQRNGRGHA